MIKKILICTALLGLVCGALSMTGCAGAADIPKYTTHSERDSGFVPKASDGKESKQITNASALDQKITSGISSVENQADAVSENISNFSNELESALTEADGKRLTYDSNFGK